MGITICLIFALSLFIPIRFTRKPNTLNCMQQKEFYIVQYISEGSTDGGNCIVVGNQNGTLVNGLSVKFTGKNPKDILSYDIYNSYTEFLIYGKLIKDTEQDYYILNSQTWEIYDKVKRGNYSLRIPFQNYITIYDLNWFDFLLTDKGYD